jgi:hypothetical protein
MGSRSWTACFVALAAAGVMLTTTARTAPAAGAPGTPWTRPVAGAVARPFVEPVSRYGAGHRGVDLVAPAGTAVRAANAGEVTFAGPVAGFLHVVVAHDGGLRTSYSFLATVAVRRGQRVPGGAVVGTAGGGTGEHAGVLHLGLRIGDRYVDPMGLFAPTDLTRLIRLVPAGDPDRHGLDPPALEQRSLAESLHLPQGVPGADAEAGSGGLLGTVAGAAGDALGEVAALAGAITAPARAALSALGRPAAAWWRRTPAAALVSDAGRVGARLVDWVRSRRDCTDDPSPPAGGGGSGHRALAVAGLGSRTDPGKGETFALDTARLGYRAGEVRWFSYAPGGGPYGPGAANGDVRRAARRVGAELRELQRSEPGREVDLVGHSLGGAVIAEFLTSGYDPADPTLPPLGTVVTLSSPLRGTPAATAVARIGSSRSGRAALGAAGFRAGTATRQVAEGSRFTRGLAARPLPEQIDLTAIGAVDDVVVPADHATRAGAREAVVNPAGVADHQRVVADPAAVDAVRLALEGRPPPCVGLVDGVRGAVEPVLISRAERTAGEIGRAAGSAVDRVERGGAR